MSIRTRAIGIVCAACVAASGYVFGQRSNNTLELVSPRMQSVARCAIQYSAIDFIVYHGYRTDEEQRSMIARGVSWVNRSRHQDGKAIDVVALDAKKKAIWNNPTAYKLIADAFYYCGDQLGTPITWGGEWRVQDLVHFEERSK